MSKVASSELWSKGDFRVHTISRLVGIQENPFNLVVAEVPITEGLGIEHKVGESQDGHPVYCVMAFMRPDKDGGCHYESVDSRIEEYCQTWDDILSFREALRFAELEIGKAFEEACR